jgi:hypothetical protein
MKMLKIKVFLLICCIILLSACGKDNPTNPEVLSINIYQGEQISELRPIVVKFNEEMAHVEIMIDGPDGRTKGIVTLNGDTAVWTPSSNALSSGTHSIFVTGINKSGQQLVGFNPIVFVHPITPPQVLSIGIHQGEEISELRPITVKFNDEMAHVEIMIDGPNGPKGIVTLNGDTAIWTPSSNALSQGPHTIFVTGINKSGQQLVGFNPIVFVHPIQNPWEAISKAAVADLWFPGNIGSKWVYGTAGEKMVLSVSPASLVELNGKSYKAIMNASFPGEISGLPLYVFRIADSKILGYAEEDKKQVEAVLEDEFRSKLRGGLHDQLIDAGFTESDIQNIQIKHESMDEWVILDKQGLVPGGSWVVRRTHTSAWIKGQKITDRIQGIRAFVVGVGFAKEFGNQAFGDLPVAYVEYKVVDEDLQGNPKNSYFLFGLCISPGVGMMSNTGTKGAKTELQEYNIEK